MRRTQAASRSGGVDKNFKRGFGCMVWELIAWIVPGYLESVFVGLEWQ